VLAVGRQQREAGNPGNTSVLMNNGLGLELKALVGASPVVFGARIPDFLLRLVALSNFMRLL
jgi:hypothetical protein